MEHYEIINPRAKHFIFYMHGGGYLIGSKNDLPEKLLTYFTKKNFGIVLLDYPLAPFSQHHEIINDTSSRIDAIIKKHKMTSYSFMGRSSGANLVLSLPINEWQFAPKFLILFYGYESKQEAWMNKPVQNIAIKTDETLLNKWIKNQSHEMNRDIETNYYYYLAAREHGKWPEIIGFKNIPISYDSETPCFLFHSIFDPDVPYKSSLSLKKYFTNTMLHTTTLAKHACDHDENELNLLILKLEQFLMENR